MTIHNSAQFQPMQLKIIGTFFDGRFFDEVAKEHESKVDEFNRNYVVFFNQGTEISDLGTSSARIVSVILYAQPKTSFNVQPPKQGTYTQGGMN